MFKLHVIVISLVFSIIGTPIFAQESEWQTIRSSELIKWNLLGTGKVSQLGEQICLQETTGSKGITLVSPSSFDGSVRIQYKVFALTAATVIVTMTAVSDLGESEELTVPLEYDGGIGLWYNHTENYFFAFKNASHNRTPFVRKNPNSQQTLGSAETNVMIPGKYYSVEIGQDLDKLWLKIDDQIMFETSDKEALTGGHVAIRLRGTAGFEAAALIKDFKILNQ